MNRLFLNLLAIVLVMAIHSCNNGNAQNNQELSAIQFSHHIKKLPSAQVLDVRTLKEYSKGHLQNAKNFDWNGEDFIQHVSTLDTSQPVFVYCLSGARSAAAASAMRDIGFKEVYELKGGIIKWRSEGLPEVTSERKNNNEMTKVEYNALVNTDKMVLIDFYAEWCGPCKKMEPYLEELKTEMNDSLVIVRIDVDNNQSLVNELQVNALPTLLLYKDKKLIWSNTGYISKTDLVKYLK